jgi:hypothetical protein
MTNIIHFDGFGDNSDIRVTPDGCFSVFDVIKFCGKKNPRDTWKSLCASYPEVVGKTDNFKFDGQGQRETPVATRESILYIIGLLPGAIGRAYREQAAKVFIQYIDASPELAESVIDRATPQDLARIEKRLQSKKIRVTFTTVLQDHGVTEGWQFGAITNSIYKPILGDTAKQVRESKGLAKAANIRDNIDSLELTGIMFAEELTQRDIAKKNLFGFQQCNNSAKTNATNVKKLIDER